MDIWREIEDFPSYEVSDTGLVRNRSTKRVLKQTLNMGSNRWWLGLRRDNKQHHRAVHKLVAHAYLGDAPPGCVPIFKDGDRDNKHAENLMYVPLWKARELTADRQKKKPKIATPIYIPEENTFYRNSLEVAMVYHIPERMVVAAYQNGVRFKGMSFKDRP